jgi:hypothetical protein
MPYELLVNVCSGEIVLDLFQPILEILVENERDSNPRDLILPRDWVAHGNVF